MPVGKSNNKNKETVLDPSLPPTLKGRKAVMRKMYSTVQIEASPDQKNLKSQMNTKVLFLWSTLKQSSCSMLEITCLVFFKLACKWSCKIIVKATFMKNNHLVYFF